MYIPPSVFVVSSIGSALVNLVFTVVPFFLIAFALRAPLSVTWLYFFVACIQVTLFTLGVGLLISTMVVFFNDVYEMYMVVLTAFNYLTPVFYPISVLPPFLQRIEVYNPMYLYVSAAQKAVVGTAIKLSPSHYLYLPPSVPDVRTQLVGWAAALIMLALGWLLFTRTEGKFAYHF
jgi:ABC-type polysaccharide/polyol phosphate export permease